jgi:hypothetical protein
VTGRSVKIQKVSRSEMIYLPLSRDDEDLAKETKREVIIAVVYLFKYLAPTAWGQTFCQRHSRTQGWTQNTTGRLEAAAN